MKNLKKVLALVLVVVMAFSLVTIGSAAFTDQKDIKYTEAVGVMTGIGAINGYPDGSFGPKGLVTRAEAAKMITYAILGPTVAAALPKLDTGFADVTTTHWASPFVAYCANQGIINGRDATTFDPNGNVTGAELAKMLLAAAGYGKNDEYVGASWEINVIKDAMKNDVFAGNETANFAVAATREEAALYIFNGIYNVGQVDYNELFGYYAKGGSALNPPSDGETIAEDIYNMNNVAGIVTGGSISSPTAKGTDVVLANISTDGKVVDLNTVEIEGVDYLVYTNFKFDATAADMGQLTSIYYNTVTGKVFYTETMSKNVRVYFATSTPNGYNTTFGSVTFGPAAEMITFANNYTASTLASTVPGLTIGTVAPAGYYVTFGGQIISFVSSIATKFEKVNAVSTTLGSESITIGGVALDNKPSLDTVKEYTGIAAGDYVVTTAIGTMISVEKCTTVDGKISTVGQLFGMNWTITMDGKNYDPSSASGTAGLTEDFPDVKAEFDGNTYTLYLDASGKYTACVLKSGITSSSVVYVAGPEWTVAGDFGTSVYKVQAVNSAAEQVIYTATVDPNVTAGFYKVTVDGDGYATFGAFDVTDLAVAATDMDPLSNDDALTATTIKNGANYYFAADTTFIFVSGSKDTLKITKVVGLAAVAGVDLNASDLLIFNKTDNANKTIKTVIVTAPFAGGVADKTVYINFLNFPASVIPAGTEYYVYIDGVSTKVTAKDTTVGPFWSKFVTYTVDSNGVYDFTGVNTASNVVNNATIAANGVFNGNITTAAGTVNASGAKVVDLTQAFGDPAVYTSVAALEAVTATKTFTVSYATNAAGVVTVIYVEAANPVA